MIDVKISARRVGAVYEVVANLGKFTPSLKWDTGAKYTVISARTLEKTISDSAIELIKTHCEKKHKRKERFVSASGDPFYGYLSHSEKAVIDETELQDFYYYLVLENKRDVALLGDDFIGNCKGSFEPHGDIIVTGFDEKGYVNQDRALESDELISLIDSLSD